MVITSFKYKPLLPAGAAEEAFKPERVLKRLEREVLKKIRGHLTQTTFSNRAKRALAQGLKIEVLPKSIRVTATHPAFGPLVKGMDEQQMTWLTKATRPIPIITEDGELIFRSATPKSMADGKWIHPGHPKTTVLERAREEAREIIKARLEKDFAKSLRATLGRK
jgi:hypothetical protein